jgi:hypothetical protein
MLKHSLRALTISLPCLPAGCGGGAVARTTPAGTARSRLSRRTYHDGEAIGMWRVPWTDAPLWPSPSPLCLALAP